MPFFDPEGGFHAMSEDLKFLAAALRHLRLKRGWTQVGVATKASITKAMLSSYEKGRQYPQLPTLMKILRVQGYSLADLHEAICLMQGDCAVLVVPAGRLPPWARPLVHEIITQIVRAASSAIDGDGVEGP